MQERQRWLEVAEFVSAEERLQTVGNEIRKEVVDPNMRLEIQFAEELARNKSTMACERWAKEVEERVYELEMEVVGKRRTK